MSQYKIILFIYKSDTTEQLHFTLVYKMYTIKLYYLNRTVFNKNLIKYLTVINYTNQF